MILRPAASSPAASPSPAGKQVDSRRARGDATRRAILRRAVQIASVDGLEGLSLGRLASELGISKSGLFAHFGSKEELQLATLRAARRIFVAEVIDPAGAKEEGLERLAALFDGWADHVTSGVFAGGCFFAAVSAEFDGRPGPVRDAVADMVGGWLATLAEQGRIARDRGEVAPEVDPHQLAWELHAIELGMNWDLQLNGGEAGLERARTAVRGLLDRAAAPAGGPRA